MTARQQSVAVAGLLVALTVALTWPLGVYPDSAVADLGDPLFNSWALAWLGHVLGTAPTRLFDANSFHPHRLALAYSDHLLGLLPIAGPVGFLGGGPVLTHNVVVLATFPLAGLAMFWLVRYLTEHAGAAVVAALLYAFSNYRLAQLGHVQLLSHQWLPLVLLGLHRAEARGARWRDLALAALAFAVQALSAGYYAYIGAVAVALFVVWVAAPASRPPLSLLARRGLIMAALTVAALVPAFLPYVWVRQDGGLVRDLAEVRLYSARPLSYLAVPPVHRWLSEATATLRRAEDALFPGALTLILAIVGATIALRPRDPAPGHGPSPSRDREPRSPWPRLLDLVLVALLLGTLANALVVGGFVVDLGAFRLSLRRVAPALLLLSLALAVRRIRLGRPTPLPGLGWLRRLGWPSAAGYYVLLTVVGVLCSFGPALRLSEGLRLRPLYWQLYQYVPGFDGLRVPARFAVLVSMGLAVLAGYGVAAIARQPDRLAIRRAVVVACAALALAEAWPVLDFVEAPTEPAAPDRWLAAAPDPGPVVVLPMYRKPDAHLEARRLLSSTAHWRPLVNGYSGFFPRGYWETVETLNGFPADAAVARMQALGVRYVVLNLGQFPRRARERLETTLTAPPPGLVPVAVFQDGAIVELRRPP